MTKNTFKPQGYSTVSPYLIVDDASATLKFLKEVFEAVEVQRFAGEAGRILHAEARIDDSVVMVADSAEGWPAQPANVHVYVEDVDSTYERAMAWGATSVQAPAKSNDEDDRRGGVADAGGTTWWIATKVS